MNKQQVRQYKGQTVSHHGQDVTIIGSHMIEKSGGTNVTMVRVATVDGETYEVSSRLLKITLQLEEAVV